jgi:multiple sugar transport system substrate-binding protein
MRDDVSDREEKGVSPPQTTRREFLRKTGAGALVIVYGGAFAKTSAAGVPKYRGRQLQNELRVLQWSHFVPGYDTWYDGTYIKQWGQRNDTEVKVDHINLAQIPARAAAEVAAQSGHDIVQFLAPPAQYEDQVINHREIVEEVTKAVGKMGAVGYKSTFNPKTKKYFGFPDNYVPDPVHYRRDLWSDIGRAPNSWEDIRAAAPLLRAAGHPIGIGMSQELDSNMAAIALMQCYGGFIQNRNHRCIINTKGTRDALAAMRDIYRRGMTSEVFAWTAASNNDAYLAGRLSLVLNAISVARSAEKQNPDLAAKTWIAPIPRGPFQRLGLEHVMGVFVVWKFAKNRRGAVKFIADIQKNYGPHFRNSEFYNFPAFPGAVRGGFKAMRRATAADKNRPLGKYTILTTIAERYTTNVGHPGFSNAAVDETFNKFLLPQMFAQVAQDRSSPEDAARDFQRQIGAIFAKWRDLRKI